MNDLTWRTSTHSMNGQCVQTALVPVEMNDGIYGKSSHSGGGGCVVARVEVTGEDTRDA